MMPPDCKYIQGYVDLIQDAVEITLSKEERIEVAKVLVQLEDSASRSGWYDCESSNGGW
jgi:septum formation topological specificity factor MinE